MKIELLGGWSCADQSIKTAEVMRELDGTMVAVLQAALCRFEQLHRPGFQNPENFLGVQTFRIFKNSGRGIHGHASISPNFGRSTVLLEVFR